MRFTKMFAAAVIAVGLIIGGGGSATAVAPARPVSVVALQPTGPTVGGQLATGGIVVIVPRADGDLVTPQFSVGFGRGIYIYFTQAEQQMIATGSGAFLAAALCAGSFGIACAAASVAVAVVLTWIDNRGGICTGSKPRLEVFQQWGSNVWIPKCVK